MHDEGRRRRRASSSLCLVDSTCHHCRLWRTIAGWGPSALGDDTAARQEKQLKIAYTHDSRTSRQASWQYLATKKSGLLILLVLMPLGGLFHVWRDATHWATTLLLGVPAIVVLQALVVLFRHSYALSHIQDATVELEISDDGCVRGLHKGLRIKGVSHTVLAGNR